LKNTAKAAMKAHKAPKRLKNRFKNTVEAIFCAWAKSIISKETYANCQKRQLRREDEEKHWCIGIR
jgi:hypothetical protein